MNQRAEDLGPLFPDQNPFATWAVRPGAIGFRFLNGDSTESLLDRLRQQQWWGQVVGPHGSGKSTLVRTLAASLSNAGRDVKRFTVKRGERQLPIVGNQLKEWGPLTQVIVEGYENLGLRNRQMIERFCKQQQAGLLVTTHEPLELPMLYQTAVSLELAQTLVQDLLPEDAPLIQPADVEASFQRHGQNLRELLFEMYDLYERRRRHRDSS